MKAAALLGVGIALLASSVLGDDGKHEPNAGTGSRPGIRFASNDCRGTQEVWNVWCSPVPQGGAIEAGNWGDAFDAVFTRVQNERPPMHVAFQYWQSILNEEPPLSVALFLRLMMGAPLTAPYNTGVGAKDFRDGALPWYEQMLRDYGGQHGHEAIMIAKIHMGKLICSGGFGETEFRQAEQLWEEVLSVPAADVIFDHPQHVHLNLDAIAQARAHVRIAVGSLSMNEEERRALYERAYEPAHEVPDRLERERLREERRTVLEWLREATIRELMYGYSKPGVRRVGRDRLLLLKTKRTDDRFYQDTLDHILRDFDREH